MERILAMVVGCLVIVATATFAVAAPTTPVKGSEQTCGCVESISGRIDRLTDALARGGSTPDQQQALKQELAAMKKLQAYVYGDEPVAGYAP